MRRKYENSKLITLVNFANPFKVRDLEAVRTQARLTIPQMICLLGVPDASLYRLKKNPGRGLPLPTCLLLEHINHHLN